jgi:uncharacterized protein YpmB
VEKMKKLFLILGILILILAGISIKVYLTAAAPIKTAESKALQIAKGKVQISKVEDFHVYHGQETVDVIEGKNTKGEKIIVWIPEKTKKVIVKKAKSGLTKEEAVEKLLQEETPKKIISVRLGMEKNIPLWEIYYRSNNNLINYYYVHFETGEWLKKIENL